jgi:hypothetical protein
MVLIKKLNLKNWADEQRLPDNILVVCKQNGKLGEIGIVRALQRVPGMVGEMSFEIVTVGGRSFGLFDGVEAIILRWSHIFDFFYIEIKP